MTVDLKSSQRSCVSIRNLISNCVCVCMHTWMHAIQVFYGVQRKINYPFKSSLEYLLKLVIEVSNIILLELCKST